MHLPSQFKLQNAISCQSLLEIDDFLTLESLDVHHGFDGEGPAQRRYTELFGRGGDQSRNTTLNFEDESYFKSSSTCFTVSSCCAIRCSSWRIFSSRTSSVSTEPNKRDIRPVLPGERDCENEFENAFSLPSPSLPLSNCARIQIAMLSATLHDFLLLLERAGQCIVSLVLGQL